MNQPLLKVEDLNIFFKSDKKAEPVHALRNVSFEINQGEMLGVVGESGSGKSITNLAIMGLLSDNAIIKASECSLGGTSLLNLNENQWQNIRGKVASMIFQDPMTALNPFLTVEYQLVETIMSHQKCTKKEAIEYSMDLLSQVGITSPKERLKAYPFELSGGMAQRVMIAMAISSNPKLLIADEPTTALDVTIQKQILLLLKELQQKKNMAVLLVTHDLGVVSEFSDRIQVMYAGELVETGTTANVIKTPHHPYTKALLNSRPGSIDRKAKSQLPSISGIVPSFHERPAGCQFNPRCEKVSKDCLFTSIPLKGGIRCIHPINYNQNGEVQ
jgi:dipeptide transport system ATP-binding protein